MATPASVQLVAVGDISLGDSPNGVGAGVHAAFERRLGTPSMYPFENTQQILTGPEIVFGNLETVLSHAGMSRWHVKTMEMRGHPEGAKRLAEAGFNVLNVANNHMMQHGNEAFLETVEALNRHSVGVVGLGRPDHQGCVPHVISRNGLNITVLGFAFEEDKYATGPVAYAYGPQCDIVAQIAEAKRHSDLVICSVHWGVEFVRHPALQEEELGRRFVDAGADLVLGHHPHVARRVERYGRGLIAYSLGNFVFDMPWNPWLRTGLVLRVRLSRAGVEDYGTELVWIGDDHQPRQMSPEQAGTASREFADLERRPDWLWSTEEYDRRYGELVVRNRYESYRHFLRTLGQRPVTYSAQTLLRTAGRKVTDRFR